MSDSQVKQNVICTHVYMHVDSHTNTRGTKKTKKGNRKNRMIWRLQTNGLFIGLQTNQDIDLTCH